MAVVLILVALLTLSALLLGAGEVRMILGAGVLWLAMMVFAVLASESGGEVPGKPWIEAIVGGAPLALDVFVICVVWGVALLLIPDRASRHGLGAWARDLSADVVWVVSLTLAIEIITCMLRFGLEMESTRDTAVLSPLTFGIRIHHGYVGLLLLLVSLVLNPRHSMRSWVRRAGWALFGSDMIHHFVVLWLVVGDPQFHLTYS